MTGYAPRVVCHLGLLSFLGPLQPLSMALKTIPETQFLMHLDHLRIFAVATLQPWASRLVGVIHAALTNTKNNNVFI